MAKNVNRNLGKRLKMVLHICEQECEIAELMIMRHGPSPDPPEPLNTISIGIISRCDKRFQGIMPAIDNWRHLW